MSLVISSTVRWLSKLARREPIGMRSMIRLPIIAGGNRSSASISQSFKLRQ